MAASIYFQSGQVVLDNNGRVAPGAKLYFFDGNTTTPRDTFSDSDLTSTRTHPVVADGYGRIPVIYLSYGTFDVKVTTSGGTQLFYHTNIANPEPFSETTTFDTTKLLSTGRILPGLENETLPGFVRLNGRTIGNTLSSATERADDDTSDLFAFLWNKLANAQAPVSGGRGGSAAADFAANKRITLPDWRACSIVGFEDMGNTANNLTANVPFVTGDAITPGSILGENTHTLVLGELPSHTHGAGSFGADSGGSHTHSLSSAGTAASAGAHEHNLAGGTATAATSSSGAHTHTISTQNAGVITSDSPTGPFATTGAGTAWGPVNGQTLGADSNGNHTHTFSGHTDSSGSHSHDLSGNTDSGGAHTHTVSGTSGSAGSGSVHNNVGRSGMATWFIKL